MWLIVIIVVNIVNRYFTTKWHFANIFQILSQPRSIMELFFAANTFPICQICRLFQTFQVSVINFAWNLFLIKSIYSSNWVTYFLGLCSSYRDRPKACPEAFFPKNWILQNCLIPSKKLIISAVASQAPSKKFLQ